jgi:two-component system phosphate regulon response regulator OmpR
MPLLYIVDDDAELRRIVTEYLGKHGFETVGLCSGDEMLRRLPRLRPELVILDLMMPGTGGLEVLKQLRETRDDLPVILLTAASDETERIAGLDLGADDYIGKPFSIRELLSRVRAVLRRRGMPNPRAPEARDAIAIGGLVLDARTRTLIREGRTVDLNPSDFALLRVLASNPFRPLSRNRLLELSGGVEAGKQERSIDAQIVQLRRVLEDDPARPRILQTVRGVGYVFVPP